VTVELLAILLAALGLAAPHSPAAQDRVCFSKQLWSGRDELRPCVRITELHEDGSFEASVGDARGDLHHQVRIGNRAN
jgi:hypothetical protein